MRKILIIAVLFLSTFCQSQETSTTVDEYNFLTKGIRELKEKGLDVKKDGYSLEVFFSTIPKINKRETFYELSALKDKNNEVKAIGITIQYGTGTGAMYYLCYPINNPELLKKHLKDYEDHELNGKLYVVMAQAVEYLYIKKN